MSAGMGTRAERRLINLGTVIIFLVLFGSALSPVIENAVGLLVLVVLALAGIRAWWELVGRDARADRELIREIGPLDGPPPILLQLPDGTERIIPSTDPAYPRSPETAAAQIRDQVLRARAAEAAAALVRQNPDGGPA